MERDVVCGTYYFCSKGCKAKLDASPSQFVK